MNQSDSDHEDLLGEVPMEKEEVIKELRELE